MHVAIRKHTVRFFAMIAMMAVTATALSAKKDRHRQAFRSGLPQGRLYIHGGDKAAGPWK